MLIDAKGSRRWEHSGAPRAALILGAGWSKSAGLPLAAELFDQPPDQLLQWAKYMAKEVPEAYRQWRISNPDENAESFVGRVYQSSFPFDLPGTYFPYHSTYDPQMQLPEPLEDCIRQWHLSWPDMSEYLQLRLAWPLEPARWATELRYKAHLLRSSRCAAQIAAIREVLARFDLLGAVTANYDVTLEQVLGMAPTSEWPGFNYGNLRGVYHPPNTPFPRERQQFRPPSGLVRLSKLHGSLNWSPKADGDLDIYCDLRAAFRRGGTAAIIPPLPEKQVPSWLDHVWGEAFATLREADVWVVIGYSLPAYDIEVRRLFSAANHGQHIEILDPNAPVVAGSFAEIAPNASYELRPGLGDSGASSHSQRRRGARSRGRKSHPQFTEDAKRGATRRRSAPSAAS